MKFSHRTLTFIAGFVWLAIGIWLLALGLHFVMDTVRIPALTMLPGRFSITEFMTRFVTDRTQAVMLCLILALMLGYVKGRMVLAKSVLRQIKRIESLPNPASLKLLYGKGYYLLIALMVGLGISMRFLPITLDTRGIVDIVIGSALMNGAMLYYRTFTQRSLKKKSA